MKNEERSLATKQKFADGLKELLAEKSFDKITVKDLIEYANVTRPTFYYHFEDIYGLVAWVYENELLILLKNDGETASWVGVVSVLRYLDKNRALILNIYNSASHNMLERIFYQGTIAYMRQVVDALIGAYPIDEKDRQYIADLYTDMLADIMTRWLKSAEGRTPEELVRLLTLLRGVDLRGYGAPPGRVEQRYGERDMG